MKQNTSTYSVHVGNMGQVYSGNGRDAKRVFANYCDLSRTHYGRAQGESVTLCRDGEPIKEYVGTIDKQAELTD